MLANVALMFILLRLTNYELRTTNDESKNSSLVTRRSSFVALALIALIIVWGWLTIPKSSAAETFTIAAITDMSNQDSDIFAKGGDLFRAGIEGPYADTPEMSQAIFDLNAGLTRQAAESQPAFVVWPENEFADADDPQFMEQVGDLAVETGAYIMADTVWRSSAGMHDAALLMGTDGEEAGRWAKTHLFFSEGDYGFVSGEPIYSIADTPYGKVGGGVCYDYHYLDVVRTLAQNGAQIILMPTDDDFSATPWFPPFHASDAIFRAAEHRLAFAAGTTNGKSVVVDPYGRIVAEGEINERGVISGEVFTSPKRTLYTRFGDWFGWLMVVLLPGLAGVSFKKQ
ncbi:MAG: hypothetical protein B6243_03240 [Anaerolineaceae bacterium 4572_5.2]|nr:MAG: hypothetical protein B6243_03240 [Anaerolineaceae bacterium 4572_5.2]